MPHDQQYNSNTRTAEFVSRHHTLPCKLLKWIFSLSYINNFPDKLFCEEKVPV
jgi:hypothetical protein